MSPDLARIIAALADEQGTQQEPATNPVEPLPDLCRCCGGPCRANEALAYGGRCETCWCESVPSIERHAGRGKGGFRL